MNDTHTTGPTNDRSSNDGSPQHPVDELAALDPAEAPAAAEQYARELAGELEAAGAAAPEPVQLQADMGDGSSQDTNL